MNLIKWVECLILKNKSNHKASLWLIPHFIY